MPAQLLSQFPYFAFFDYINSFANCNGEVQLCAAHLPGEQKLN